MWQLMLPLPFHFQVQEGGETWDKESHTKQVVNQKS